MFLGVVFWSSGLLVCWSAGLLSNAAAQVVDDPVLPSVGGATLAGEVDHHRVPPRALSEEVIASRVLAQVEVPVGAGGALLTMSRIEPPAVAALPAAADSPRVVPAFTAAQRAALRADAPLKNLLFVPTVTLYPGGISLVSWSTLDAQQAPLEYEAWVPHDLTSINMVGAFRVGRIHYALIGLVRPAAGEALSRAVPTLEELDAMEERYHLSKGDAGRLEDLEPLRALLVIYNEEAAQLAASYAEVQRRQLAFEQWERENPEPARPVEIRFWSEEPAATDPAPAR